MPHPHSTTMTVGKSQSVHLSRSEIGFLQVINKMERKDLHTFFMETTEKYKSDIKEGVIDLRR
jgi:hypothetical protein